MQCSHPPGVRSRDLRSAHPLGPVSPDGSAVHLPSALLGQHLPISTALNQERPRRPRTPSLPSRVGQLAARGMQGSASDSFGLSGTSRFASNRHTAGHVQVGPPSHPPNPPPRNLFPWPGYHIRNGSSCSSTRVNFEFRPSGPRSLEQAQPSLVASRHTLRGPAARQGEEPIPSHKCDGREAIPGRGRNESTTWTTRTTHAPNFWFRPVPGLHQRTQWQADALAFPWRWKHLSSPLVPHPQSYIKVVDPPPNLSFSPFQPHSFWSSILPVTVFCPPSF
jgi:hypothetical protein